MIRLKKKITQAFASAQRTADAYSGPIDAEAWDDAIVYVNCTAAASGQFNILLEFSPDDGTTWYSISGGNQAAIYRAYETSNITATGKTATVMPGPLGKLVRLYAYVTGATDITFSCDLELIKQGD